MAVPRKDRYRLCTPPGLHGALALREDGEKDDGLSDWAGMSGQQS